MVEKKQERTGHEGHIDRYSVHWNRDVIKQLLWHIIKKGRKAPPKMPGAGLEPAQAVAHYPLKVACLPVPPSRQRISIVCIGECLFFWFFGLFGLPTLPLPFLSRLGYLSENVINVLLLLRHDRLPLLLPGRFSQGTLVLTSPPPR